ncbi:Small, acid-soluble spore protein, alpha/beta type [Paenibacillus tianmuensis]|uniref:Small, acid-soluble spore protein, alpha/beta type n=1 Tax=Paenibacillus tianmuensis TaxID=624147 RepID=A0A1G4STD9_9BACL|nr:Small, acid-soluble spore protein, alpha/beta type [Paenibacillus tianmuensis]
MGRRSRGVMSESFKYELAKDLGFYETVQQEGWSGIRTKDAGNMVKRAIQIAEQALANQHSTAAPVREPVGSQPGPVGSQANATYGQPPYAGLPPAYTVAPNPVQTGHTSFAP